MPTFNFTTPQTPPLRSSPLPAADAVPRNGHSIDTEQPEFPLSALNGRQRAIVESVANTYDQHPSLAGVASVAAIGAAVGRGYAVVNASSGCTTYPNIFALISADRSVGKGVSSRDILGPIIEANSRLLHAYTEEELPRLKVQHRTFQKQLDDGYKAEVINEADLASIEHGLEEIKLQIKHPPAFYTGSATGAATSELLARNNEQLLLFSPEAGDAVKVALGRFTADNSADIDLLLSGYCVEPFSESRISRGQKHFERPCISVCWYIQPTLLSELIADEKAVDRGLTARFLYAAPPAREIPHDDGQVRCIPASVRDAWAECIQGLLQFRDLDTQHVGCHPDAREAFRSYHNEMVDLRNGRFREMQGDLGRARENAIRIALGQCLADAVQSRTTPSEITLDQAERGIRIARYSYAQFISIMSPVREAKLLKRLNRLKEICRDTGGQVSVNDLGRRHSFTRDVITDLVERYPNHISMETIPPGPAGGRPSEVVRARGLGGSVGYVGGGGMPKLQNPIGRRG